MKILTITNLYPPLGIGGYEERCYQTVQGLKAKGHEVTVLTSNHGLTSDKDQPAGEEEIYRQLRVHGFFGHPWLPIHKLFTLEKHNQKILRQKLESIQPDVVHVWNMGGITKSLLLTLQLSPFPVQYDISDHWIARSLSGDVWLSWWNDPGTLARRLLRGFLRMTRLAKRISRHVPIDSYEAIEWRNIYFCSRFMRRITASKGYRVGHADIVYCGVEAEKFQQKTGFTTTKRLLWVGRLAPDKDPLTAILALRLLNIRGNKLYLDLYGRGDEVYLEKLREAIKEGGLEEQVAFRSATHEEMKKVYSRYDALLFTSNWGEPFALTPLEAMASCLPVVMCPDGGDAELARDGENCLMFEAGNHESLADSLERLLRLDDHGRGLAETARREIDERYNMPVIINQIEGLLIKTADSGNDPEKTSQNRD